MGYIYEIGDIFISKSPKRADSVIWVVREVVSAPGPHLNDMIFPFVLFSQKEELWGAATNINPYAYSQNNGWLLKNARRIL